MCPAPRYLVQVVCRSVCFWRLSDLAREYLNQAIEFYGGDSEVGIVAAVFELNRPDGWYGVGYTCSDYREWVQSGLFREAIRLADQEDSVFEKPL
jgi:hypothetical protein